MGVARRLFVFDYNNLDKAFRQFKDSLMEDDDFYLIIKRDDIKVNSNVETVLKILLNKGVGDIKDTKELPDASYNAFVIATICSKVNKKTNVYFIASPELYDFVRKHIEGKAGYVCQKATLACVKHNDFVDVNINEDEEHNKVPSDTQKHNEKENESQNKYNNRKDRKVSQNVDSGLGDLLEDIYEFQKQTQNQQQTQKQQTQKQSNNIRHNESYARAPNNNKVNSKDNKSQPSANNGKKKFIEAEDTEDIRSIEKKIFFSAKIEEIQEREYSEIDDDKFRILTSTFERFKKHISLQILNEESLNEEDYEELIIYLVKSTDLNDFNNSKNIVKLKADIEMDTETYHIFKSEAQYYIKMCDLFYKDDKW